MILGTEVVAPYLYTRVRCLDRRRALWPTQDNLPTRLALLRHLTTTPSYPRPSVIRMRLTVLP